MIMMRRRHDEIFNGLQDSVDSTSVNGALGFSDWAVYPVGGDGSGIAGGWWMGGLYPIGQQVIMSERVLSDTYEYQSVIRFCTSFHFGPMVFQSEILTRPPRRNPWNSNIRVCI